MLWRFLLLVMKSVWICTKFDESAELPSQTTAHAVALTLGMLALYPEEQQSVYQQIQEYTVDGLLVSVGSR